MTFLTLKGLTKRYDSAADACVNAIDLDVDEGQIVVLLGPSGSGKTTTLKMIAGLIEPTSGDILIEDQSIVPVPADKRDVSLVFQKPLLFPHMTVAQNIGFGLKMKGAPRNVIAQKVVEMLKLVRLDQYGDRRTTQLSGGQEQRVSLARGLVIEPKILLLDEPLSALDAELRLEMRELILKLKEEFNVTLLYVTHDQQEALMLADKIALMIDGKIVQYGASQTVYTKPRTKRVAEFFGWANFVPANKKGKVVSSCFGDFLFDDLDQEDGDLLLTIRPEAAAVCGKDEGFQAVVRSSVYVGTKINYLVDCLGESLSITLDTNHVFEKGDILFLKFNGDKVWAVPPCPRKQVEKTTRPVDSQVSN